MVSSPSTRDEDNNSKWGGSGKTAKLVAAKWCSDNGYYNHTIIDDGRWYFSAECSGSVPVDWSRPFSDEAAVADGFRNRNEAAKADCIKKGFGDIDSSKYVDKGTWNFSLKCKQDASYVIGDYTDAGCQLSETENKPGRHWWGKLDVGNRDWQTAADSFAKNINDNKATQKIKNQDVIEAKGRKDLTGAYIDVWTKDPNCDVKWDNPVTGRDSANNILTIQKCNNWIGSKALPGGDAKSCLNSPSKPAAKKWINCAIGSSPGGIAPGDGALACSPLSKDADSFPCIGGQNCFAVIDQTEVPVTIIGDYTDAGCQLSETENKPGHHWWGKLDVGNRDWQTAADSFAETVKAKGMFKGEELIVKAEDVIEAKGRKDLTGAYIDIWTKDPKCDVKWDNPVTGCDGAGHELTIQKCNNWIGSKALPGGDAKSCLNSPSKPAVKKWINCAIGSSPGGIAPGDGGPACSPLSPDADSFPCIGGQNCFAVIEQKDDLVKCPKQFLSDPFGAASDFFTKYYYYIIAVVVVIIILIILGLLSYLSVRSSPPIPYR